MFQPRRLSTRSPSSVGDKRTKAVPLQLVPVARAERQHACTEQHRLGDAHRPSLAWSGQRRRSIRIIRRSLTFVP